MSTEKYVNQICEKYALYYQMVIEGYSSIYIASDIMKV